MNANDLLRIITDAHERVLSTHSVTRPDGMTVVARDLRGSSGNVYVASLTMPVRTRSGRRVRHVTVAHEVFSNGADRDVLLSRWTGEQVQLVHAAR